MSTSNNSNQQTLADSGANERPPMLERENYIPWESRFRRFLDNKLEEGEQMWNSIQNGPYVTSMTPDPDGAMNINGTVKQILEQLSKMTEGNKKQYIADVKVMNYLLQAIPNDIYNSVDACKTLRKCGNELRGCCLVLMLLAIKYVTMVRHNQTGETVSYDMLYDSLVQFEPHLLASKANKSAKNQDLLALISHSNASSSHSHAHSSYSPQPYYVTHPSSAIEYEDEYQGKLQGDSQEDKLISAMMLLAQAITQKFSKPTNNHLRTSSNTRNQAMIEDGRVDIKTKNVGYGGNELTALVMLMAQILPVDDNAETVPSYDAKAVSEVNTSSKVHEQMRHEKCTSDLDSNDHDEYHKIQMLEYDVQREAENQKQFNNELKRQKMLLQKKLETCKDRVKMFELEREELERELRNDKNTIDKILK
ncbi:hypothetical protein Tco_0235923 [Tanacetum coccineum]